MIKQLGSFLADKFKKWIPDPFVFALILTLITGVLALLIVDTTPHKVVDAWYKGFWILLEFGMQITLMLVTGYCIALSPVVSRAIDWLSDKVKTPAAVYGFVVFVGGLFSLVSWGWMVLTAVLARELAQRVKGIDYAYLTACVYLSAGPWVCGLSSSIPLLLNTENNFLIKTGVLSSTIDIQYTLGSTLNLTYMVMYIIAFPLIMIKLRPSKERTIDLEQLREEENKQISLTVAEEAETLKQPGKTLSDTLNNDPILQTAVLLCGFWYIGWHFYTKGFDINLNIMIFIFIMAGMLCHRTPVRYVVAMKRACGNVSGIIFQYPFYGGIMGLMMFTGLAAAISQWMAAQATVESLPVIAFLSGAIVNFAIPSAGGEWAVIGPAFVETAKTLGTAMSPEALNAFIARIALAVAYGESSTNLLQPFFLLIILPVMGAGVRIQARDVMGHLAIPFMVILLVASIFVTCFPI